MSYALPINGLYSSIAYGATFILSIAYITLTNKELLAYDKIVQHLLLIKQSFVITGSLYMLILCVEPGFTSNTILITTYFILSLGIYAIFWNIKEHSMKSAAFHLRFKYAKDVRIFIIGLL